ncbi:MAG: hypothetical protein ACOYXS_07490 [Chloroflexota bacterium]
MARAKTTDRAEARRRYRAQLAAAAGADTDEAATGGTDLGPEGRTGVGTNGRTGPRAGTGAGTGTGTGTTPRPSLLGALRTAAAPADIRGDLRALPVIARRTKSVWLPTVLILGTGAAFLVPTLAENEIVRFLAVAVLAPPPMIPAFLAGMLTPRGSWLVGGIAGLISGLTVVVLITVTPGATSTTSGLDFQNVGFLVLAGPVFGMGVGAFAGFYRRFLALSAPPRRAARKSNPVARSGRRR